MSPSRRGPQAVLLALALVLVACGSSGDGTDDPPAGRRGGTLTFLTWQDQLAHLDPQRNYAGEDIAIASGYLHRTLNAYQFSPDGERSSRLVADLATDTGTPNEDATAWTWTLKQGLTWEDGSDLTCADVKYGISRTFAAATITGGPRYAISMLDIPTDPTGTSVYRGPYVTKGNNTAAFDRAVRCEGDRITFNLAEPVGDFDHAVTLPSFGPVPKAQDTGAKYDDRPFSSGPYKISQYSKGVRLVLVRNDNWDPGTDTYRPAYPDRIVFKFGLEPAEIDRRMVRDDGADRRALTAGDPVEPSSRAKVFGSDRFADRRTDGLDPSVRYIAVNAAKLPDLKQRQAVAVALDRAQLRDVNGGALAGELADGVITPKLPTDYASTDLWDGLLGAAVPDAGDPEAARRLVLESGRAMPALQFDYPQTPINDKAAAVVVASLDRAGIAVTPNPIEAGQFYGVVLDPAEEGHLVLAGWGPDWSNASRVVPDLFTPEGDFNLSRADDEAFTTRADAARGMTDRAAQAAEWKALNRQAMANAWVVPTRFGRDQRLAGSKVHSDSGDDGRVYVWGPFGTWPYGDLYVEP